ncbi:hypothetical protein DFJ58DRAFT_779983 [Suillus subalutaceus]|uniref:uncharacterized protein n=1 Tax=Suillus subalutaceus TaxID=48586 RepID=UPI001B880A49|nr:uncharacterized protein DFJ58DRAFT_779983 [Suillus subalutaceus]KAG1860216.1 hypothetical protein DFJ58DRAFT_779983 [Suillus subalutaceus]
MHYPNIRAKGIWVDERMSVITNNCPAPEDAVRRLQSLMNTRVSQFYGLSSFGSHVTDGVPYAPKLLDPDSHNSESSALAVLFRPTDHTAQIIQTRITNDAEEKQRLINNHTALADAAILEMSRPASQTMSKKSRRSRTDITNSQLQEMLVAITDLKSTVNEQGRSIIELRQMAEKQQLENVNIGMDLELERANRGEDLAALRQVCHGIPHSDYQLYNTLPRSCCR